MAKKFLNHFTLRPNNDFMVLYFAFYSNRKDKTFPRNLIVLLKNTLQLNSSFEN